MVSIRGSSLTYSCIFAVVNVFDSFSLNLPNRLYEINHYVNISDSFPIFFTFFNVEQDMNLFLFSRKHGWKQIFSLLDLIF